MPTHYVMKEMPDLQGKGERVTYPQMVLLGQSSTRELAEYISLRLSLIHISEPTRP